MSILIVFLAICGIIIMQVICGLLYAILEKITDKKEEKITHLWVDNFLAMWDMNDTCGYFEKKHHNKKKVENI